MTLTGPDRNEVFNWDPDEPELMKAMIMAGVQIQMPIGKKDGKLIFPERQTAVPPGPGTGQREE